MQACGAQARAKRANTHTHTNFYLSLAFDSLEDAKFLFTSISNLV